MRHRVRLAAVLSVTALSTAGVAALPSVTAHDVARAAACQSQHNSVHVALSASKQRARDRLAAAGLDGRAECVAGDFFDAVPAGADAYLRSRALHDWDDADARRILATCRAAMPAGVRLLLVDAIVPERAHDGPDAVRMDLHMLILFSARERTEAQFRELLASAGFDLRRVVSTGSPAGLSVLEATVAVATR